MKTETLNSANVRVTFNADEAHALAVFVRNALPYTRQLEADTYRHADDLAEQYRDIKRKFIACRDFGNERAANKNRHSMTLVMRDWNKADEAAFDAQCGNEAAQVLRDALDRFNAAAQTADADAAEEEVGR